MDTQNDLVFLIDVDNTLLDHDRVKLDLGRHLDVRVGLGSSDRYWHVYETLREEYGYTDVLGALQRCWLDSGSDPRWLQTADAVIDYPFAERLYPGALGVLTHLSAIGTSVIVSDGDAVMQPRKIRESGLWSAVNGRVLIYPHKQQRLDDIARQFPARHHVMIDDKLSVLEDMKREWRDHLTTVFVRQGHYAHDAMHTHGVARADLGIERIADLLQVDIEMLTVPSA